MVPICFPPGLSKVGIWPAGEARLAMTGTCGLGCGLVVVVVEVGTSVMSGSADTVLGVERPSDGDGEADHGDHRGGRGQHERGALSRRSGSTRFSVTRNGTTLRGQVTAGAGRCPNSLVSARVTPGLASGVEDGVEAEVVGRGEVEGLVDARRTPPTARSSPVA